MPMENQDLFVTERCHFYFALIYLGSRRLSQTPLKIYDTLKKERNRRTSLSGEPLSQLRLESILSYEKQPSLKNKYFN
jgi:hypothetical protein